MRYLLDTSVYSQPLKRHPVEGTIKKWTALGDRELSTSIFCEMEVLQGLALIKSDGLTAAYEKILKFRIPIIGFDRETAEVYADLQALLIKKGNRRPVIDLLIASTALHRHLTLATCNMKDFQDIPGLKLEDWS